DFLIAVGLVLLTLLPLGPRAAAVVMISIPLSLAMAVTGLAWTGFTLNQLTIVGMVIALGLLVDDSIVVVENITRFRREGYSRIEAAIRATGQIWVAVLGATATLVFAFVPLVFLPGGPGRYIRSLPVAVISTVLASLIVSLTIIPWLSSLLLGKDAGPEGNRFLRASERAIHSTYAPLLDRALRRPARTLALGAAFVPASLHAPTTRASASCSCCSTTTSRGGRRVSWTRSAPGWPPTPVPKSPCVSSRTAHRSTRRSRCGSRAPRSTRSTPSRRAWSDCSRRRRARST